MPQEGHVSAIGARTKVYVGRTDRTPDPHATHGLFTNDDDRAPVVIASARWTEADRTLNLTRIAACVNGCAGIGNPAALPAALKAMGVLMKALPHGKDVVEAEQLAGDALEALAYKPVK